jgi:hypothetical protein
MVIRFVSHKTAKRYRIGNSTIELGTRQYVSEPQGLIFYLGVGCLSPLAVMIFEAQLRELI